MIHVHAEAERNTKNAAVAKESLSVPGFLVSTASCGMRYEGRDDLALIFSEKNATAAGVFTKNCFHAAPVTVCREHLHMNPDSIRAIVVNAGIANACTGKEGLEKARKMAILTASRLAVDPHQVLVASTGVIGPQIDLELFSRALPKLVTNLRKDAWMNAARAIMTTDKVAKFSLKRISLNGKLVTVCGIAKGAGMIAPQMATMLAFIVTDANISPSVLQDWLTRAVDNSFNRITVDGDTSTNDTVILLANGCAGNPLIKRLDQSDSIRFGETLERVLLELARQIVADGEGATKLVRITVSGAPDTESARRIAFTIANSTLVKTALFGEDPNWGRVVAAAGRAGIELKPEKVNLWFGKVKVFENGCALYRPEIEHQAKSVCKSKEIELRLDVGIGTGRFEVLTCDLSYGYIKINAAYRS